MRTDEIQSWLESCLSKENITNITARIVKSTEKGDNFLSDILFTEVRSVSKSDGTEKNYDIVLKCSKNSVALRQMAPMFLHEIFIYQEVFPLFRKFQEDRNVEECFNSVPKFYGTFIGEDQEVIALEDLTKRGYNISDKRKPLSKQHIFSVVREYAKFHSISVALQDQQPEEFEKLKQKFDILFEVFTKIGPNFVRNFVNSMEETYYLLQNDLDDNILLKWKNAGEKFKTEFMEAFKNQNGLRVISHGDCWNNNFLFNSEDGQLKVTILDWQFTKLSSPISDLSYFLFSCISGDDLSHLNDFLEEYYHVFSKCLKELGSDPEILYPKQQFLDDWENLSRYSICCIPVVLKVCYVEKDQAPDVAEAAENGDASQAFNQIEVKDKLSLINRIKPIVKYVVENNLI